MREKLKYIAGPLLVIGLGVLVWSMWPEENNANFPEGTDWLCGNTSDPHHFNLSVSDLAEHTQKHYGERPKCPKCGQDAFRAEKCVHCGKVYVPGRGASVCPFCKKPQVAPPA
jgi:hypothetical protein